VPERGIPVRHAGLNGSKWWKISIKLHGCSVMTPIPTHSPLPSIRILVDFSALKVGRVMPMSLIRRFSI
jgi:hypothetical protein